MKLQGYLIVIVCCLGLAFTNISKKRYLLTSLVTPARISFIVGQGVLLLVYPLLGHLADVYLTRYRALKFSLIILTIISFAGLVYKGIDTAESILGNIKAFHHTSTGILLSVVSLRILLVSDCLRLTLFSLDWINYLRLPRKN